MPDADLKAIAVYLKERGSAGTPAIAPVPASDSRMQVGEAIFVDTCSACHTRNGDGIEHIFPRLVGNAIVKQDDPTTLVRIILTGVRGAGTGALPTSPAMPSFGYRLDDNQVAAVVTISAIAGATPHRLSMPTRSRPCAAMYRARSSVRPRSEASRRSGQTGLMPALAMMSRHFGTSASMRFFMPSGPLAMTSKPLLRNCSVFSAS